MSPALISHRSEGSGPPLLLLNGIMMSSAAWEPIAEALRPARRILRADFRGQLLSPGTPPATIAGHAGDVLCLLDHLHLDTVDVAGTSFGGLVGLTLAAEHPDRVRALVAITTTDRVTPEMWTATAPLLEATVRAAAGGDKGAVFDAIVPGTFSLRWRTAHGDALAQRRNAIASLPTAWFTGLAGLIRSVENVDLRPLLARISCPVLVIAAGQDQMFPLEHGCALAQAIPGSTLEVIADGTHGLVVEQPELTAAMIEAFVVSMEG